MTMLQHIQKSEQKRRALLGAQYTSLKAYRGIPYTDLSYDRPVKSGSTDLAYRGISYSV